MTSSRPRFAPARAGLLALLGAAALVAACDTPMPTAAEVQAMDAATAERQATRLRMVEGGEMTYIVDGEQVSAEEANAIAPDRIAQIDVQKNAQGGGTIRISTSAAPRQGGATVRVRGVRTAEGAGEERVLVEKVVVGEPAGGLLRETVAVTDTVPGATRIRLRTGSAAEGASPLILIDGVVADRSAMEALAPNRIDKVEVIKGPAATQQFSDPRAAHGVIRITTKGAARP